MKSLVFLTVCMNLVSSISQQLTVDDVPVAKRNFLMRHEHGLIQSAKQLKEEVDDVCGVAIDTPQVELSCQPCEGFATVIPPPTAGVATKQLSFVFKTFMTSGGQQDSLRLYFVHTGRWARCKFWRQPYGCQTSNRVQRQRFR